MKKICSECKTENEEQFLFCKNCGNPLEDEQRTEESVREPVVENNTPPVYTAHNPYGVPEDAPYEAKKQQTFFEEPSSISGISKEDFTTFIGNNGDKIYSKFAKMEYSGSKVSWCWPAAILQYTLGFLGGAIWFFYRKMYKLAILFVALGIVFTAATTILTYDEQVSASKDFLGRFYQLFDELELEKREPQSNENEIEDIENAPDEKGALLKSGIATVLGWLERLSTALVGMFALYSYKKHSLKKIIAFKSTAVEPQYYSYCLSLVGGTSGGMLALGIIIAALVPFVAESSIVYELLKFIGG